MIKSFKTLVFAYVIFRFYVTIINTNIQKIGLFCFLFIYIICNFRKYISKEEQKSFRYFCLSYVVLILITSIVPVLHGTFDFSYVRKFISHIMDILCMTAFVIHIKKNTPNGSSCLKTFVNEYCKILIIYILFTIVCMALPTFKSFWQTLVYFSEKDIINLRYSKYAGRIGWNGFAGYNSTLYCSFGILLCVRMLNNKTYKLEEYKMRISVLIMYVIILLFGNFLYGRTGLIVSILILFIYLIKEIILMGRIKILICSVTILMLSFFVLNFMKKNNPTIANVYNWAFEPIINYFNDEGITSTSTDSLLKMYKVPPIKTIIIGDGYYTDPISKSYYKSVDVGFLRLIYYWGIIPTIVVYLLTINGFNNTILYDDLVKYLFFMMFVLFEMKGESYRLFIVMCLPLCLLGKNLVKRKRIRLVWGKR